MKKVTALILAAMLVIVMLAACGEAPAENTAAPTPVVTAGAAPLSA